MRRLPVYFLIDCSESMAGEAIEAVQAGLISMLTYLRSDPHALETVYVSAITFNNTAQQDVPLTELTQFRSPELVLGSGTALGAALKLWEGCMAREVSKTTAERKGDYKPICFILTDGDPTDAWEDAATRIKSEISSKKAFVVAIACGPDGRAEKLRQITDDVLLSSGLDTNAIIGLFKWISASVSSASQSIHASGKETLELDRLPIDLVKRAPVTEKYPRKSDRFAFLHSKCLRNKGFYVMRFERQEGGECVRKDRDIYAGVAAHKLARFNSCPQDDESTAPRVSTDQLANPPACPYCENPSWALCSCGKVHCSPLILDGPLTLTCPWCGNSGEYSIAPTAFEVGRGQG